MSRAIVLVALTFLLAAASLCTAINYNDCSTGTLLIDSTVHPDPTQIVSVTNLNPPNSPCNIIVRSVALLTLRLRSNTIVTGSTLLIENVTCASTGYTASQCISTGTANARTNFSSIIVRHVMWTPTEFDNTYSFYTLFQLGSPTAFHGTTFLVENCTFLLAGEVLGTATSTRARRTSLVTIGYGLNAAESELPHAASIIIRNNVMHAQLKTEGTLDLYFFYFLNFGKTEPCIDNVPLVELGGNNVTILGESTVASATVEFARGYNDIRWVERYAILRNHIALQAVGAPAYAILFRVGTATANPLRPMTIMCEQNNLTLAAIGTGSGSTDHADAYLLQLPDRSRDLSNASIQDNIVNLTCTLPIPNPQSSMLATLFRAPLFDDTTFAPAIPGVLEHLQRGFFVEANALLLSVVTPISGAVATTTGDAAICIFYFPSTVAELPNLRLDSNIITFTVSSSSTARVRLIYFYAPIAYADNVMIRENSILLQRLQGRFVEFYLLHLLVTTVAGSLTVSDNSIKTPARSTSAAAALTSAPVIDAASDLHLRIVTFDDRASVANFAGSIIVTGFDIDILGEVQTSGGNTVYFRLLELGSAAAKMNNLRGGIVMNNNNVNFRQGISAAAAGGRLLLHFLFIGFVTSALSADSAHLPLLSATNNSWNLGGTSSAESLAHIIMWNFAEGLQENGAIPSHLQRSIIVQNSIMTVNNVTCGNGEVTTDFLVVAKRSAEYLAGITVRNATIQSSLHSPQGRVRARLLYLEDAAHFSRGIVVDRANVTVFVSAVGFSGVFVNFLIVPGSARNLSAGVRVTKAQLSLIVAPGAFSNTAAAISIVPNLVYFYDLTSGVGDVSLDDCAIRLDVGESKTAATVIRATLILLSQTRWYSVRGAASFTVARGTVDVSGVGAVAASSRFSLISANAYFPSKVGSGFAVRDSTLHVHDIVVVASTTAAGTTTRFTAVLLESCRYDVIVANNVMVNSSVHVNSVAVPQQRNNVLDIGAVNRFDSNSDCATETRDLASIFQFQSLTVSARDISGFDSVFAVLFSDGDVMSLTTASEEYPAVIGSTAFPSRLLLENVVAGSSLSVLGYSAARAYSLGVTRTLFVGGMSMSVRNVRWKNKCNSSLIAGFVVGKLDFTNGVVTILPFTTGGGPLLLAGEKLLVEDVSLSIDASTSTSTQCNGQACAAVILGPNSLVQHGNVDLFNVSVVAAAAGMETSLLSLGALSINGTSSSPPSFAGRSNFTLRNCNAALPRSAPADAFIRSLVNISNIVGSSSNNGIVNSLNHTSWKFLCNAWPNHIVREFSKRFGSTVRVTQQCSHTASLSLTQTVSADDSASYSAATATHNASDTRGRLTESKSIEITTTNTSAMLSETNSGAFVSRTKSRNTQSLSATKLVRFRLGLDSATVAALFSSTQSAAGFIALLGGAPPSVAVSLSRGISALRLTGCPRFAEDGSSWIDQDPGLLWTLLPTIGLGDAPGRYYRAACVGFLCVAVLGAVASLVLRADPSAPIRDATVPQLPQQQEQQQQPQQQQTSSSSSSSLISSSSPTRNDNDNNDEDDDQEGQNEDGYDASALALLRRQQQAPPKLPAGTRLAHFFVFFVAPFAGAWAAAAGTLATTGQLLDVFASVVPFGIAVLSFVFIAIQVKHGMQLQDVSTKRWKLEERRRKEKMKASQRQSRRTGTASTSLQQALIESHFAAKTPREVIPYRVVPSFIVRASPAASASSSSSSASQIAAERWLKSDFGRWALVGNVTWYRDPLSVPSDAATAEEAARSSLIVTATKMFATLVGPSQRVTCLGEGESTTSARHQHAPLFVAYTMAAATLSCVMQGISLGASNEPTLCRAAIAVNVLCGIITTCLVLWLRPFIIPLRTMLSCVIEVSVTVVAMLAFVITENSSNSNTSAMSDLLAAAQIFVAAVGWVAMLMLGPAKLLRVLTLKRAGCVIVPAPLYWNRFGEGGAGDSEVEMQSMMTAESGLDNSPLLSPGGSERAQAVVAVAVAAASATSMAEATESEATTATPRRRIVVRRVILKPRAKQSGGQENEEEGEEKPVEKSSLQERFPEI